MPKALIQPGKVRLQFDFSKEANDRMEKIQKYLDAASKAEVMRRALRLLEHLMLGKAEGYEVVLRDPEGNERILEII